MQTKFTKLLIAAALYVLVKFCMRIAEDALKEEAQQQCVPSLVCFEQKCTFCSEIFAVIVGIYQYEEHELVIVEEAFLNRVGASPLHALWACFVEETKELLLRPWVEPIIPHTQVTIPDFLKNRHRQTTLLPNLPSPTPIIPIDRCQFI